MVTKPDPLAPIRQALSVTGQSSSDYDLNADVALPPGRKLRPAGVLVPIMITDGTARVILTKRSSGLKHHPGQIAFPGGKQDTQDPDIIATALREAHEEIGLAPDNVRVLGTMAPHETVTGYLATPVLAEVRAPFDLRAEPGEVDEVFCVPLTHVLTRDNFHIEGRYWQGHLRRYYTVPYGPYYIWGATARMFRALADAAAT